MSPAAGQALVGPAGAVARLTDVLPALLAAVLASRDGAGRVRREAVARLPVDPVPRACLLLVDGLGHDLLAAHPGDAPFLCSLLPGAPVLHVGFPTTTVTSLASLGTGMPAGRHGLVGLASAVPGQGWALDALHWDRRVDPRAWQPHPTVLERAAAAGVAATRVGPRAFEGTGLTEAALRGGRAVAADTAGERIAVVQAALAAAPQTLVYAYDGDLDATGHRQGCGSPAWRAQLALVDRAVERLAEGLPPDSLLWVTGDHGMLNVQPEDRVDLAAVPELLDGVALVAGEPRARYAYARPGAAADVLATWRGILGERMDVLSRDEAVAAGWYGGPVDPTVLPRVGDVVAASRGRMSLVDSRTTPEWLLRLVGQHGSLTPAEAHVPLLAVRT